MKKLFSKRAVIMTLVALSLSVGFFPRQARAASAKESSAEAYTIIIQPGDTLSEIALHYRQKMSVIASIPANRIIDLNLIYAGREMIIPRTTHNPATQPAMPTKVAPAVLPLAPAPPISAHTVNAPAIKAIVPVKESKHSFKKIIAWSGGSAGIVALLLFLFLHIHGKEQDEEDARTMSKIIQVEHYEPPTPIKSVIPVAEVETEPVSMAKTPEVIPIEMSVVPLVAPSVLGLVDPDPTTLWQYATKGLLHVSFTQKGVPCVALFDSKRPIEEQVPQPFILTSTSFGKVFFRSEWEKLNHEAELMSRTKSDDVPTEEKMYQIA